MTDGARRRALEAKKSRARRWAVALAGALLLTGCASGHSAGETVGGWVDRMRGKATAEGQPRVSYAAARIKIYSEPDKASPVIGVVDRYEEIARYQSVSGFAFVKAEGDLSGWVPESQLLVRRPQTRQPGEVEPAQGDSAETEARPPDTEAPAEPVPPDSGAEPQEPEPSVFDPY